MKEKIVSLLKWFFKSFIWLGILLYVIDIVSKNIVVANRANIYGGLNGGIDIIPGVLGINYVINDTFMMGISFGSALANRIVYIVIAFIALGVLGFILVKYWKRLNSFYKATLFMIAAGALGNLTDRIFYSAEYLGYLRDGELVQGVVDWIDFYPFSWWPYNFNIADASIVVAAFMLIIYLIVGEIIDYRKKKESTPKVEDDSKVLSKTEQEKAQYLKSKDKDE